MSLLSHGSQRFSGFAGTARLCQRKQQGTLDVPDRRGGKKMTEGWLNYRQVSNLANSGVIQLRHHFQIFATAICNSVWITIMFDETAIILAQRFCFCPAPLTATLAMANLEGVAQEWEDSRNLRKYMRANKKIIRPLLGDDAVHITAKTAGVNRDVLAPLVMRLKDDEGSTMIMCTLPEILRQSLS